MTIALLLHSFSPSMTLTKLAKQPSRAHMAQLTAILRIRANVDTLPGSSFVESVVRCPIRSAVFGIHNPSRPIIVIAISCSAREHNGRIIGGNGRIAVYPNTHALLKRETSASIHIRPAKGSTLTAVIRIIGNRHPGVYIASSIMARVYRVICRATRKREP